MDIAVDEVSSALLASFGEAAILIVLVFAIICMFLGILIIVGKWKLFKKSGEAGWKVIVPFYNDYVFLVRICGLHWVLFLAACILTFGGYTIIVERVIFAMGYYNYALKCHKDAVALGIFGGLFRDIVGVVCGFSSNYQYDQNVPVGNCGFFNKIIN